MPKDDGEVSKVSLRSPLRESNEDVCIDDGRTNPVEVPKGTVDGYEPYLPTETGRWREEGKIWGC